MMIQRQWADLLIFRSADLTAPLKHSAVGGLTWPSGYCYLNKGECNLNQSKYDSFVEWVAIQ